MSVVASIQTANIPLMENPFLKNDGTRRLLRRPPIVLRDNDMRRRDALGARMKAKETEQDDSDSSSRTSSISGEFEYGPGIVERLRAKFARLSATGVHKEEPKRETNKKYSSCDNLLDSEPLRGNHVNGGIYSPSNDSRRHSRSISDILSEENERGFTVHRAINIDDDIFDSGVGISSISTLRKRFEKPDAVLPLPDRAIKDTMTQRFAKHYEPEVTSSGTATPPLRRSPKDVEPNPPSVALTTIPQISNEVLPKNLRVFEAKHPPAKPSTANVLNVLNDAKVSEEPEFVQIARRLRRFEPELSESLTRSYIDDDLKPAVPAFWQRRKPEFPVLSANAKIIREAPVETISQFPTPPDPHSARLSKEPSSVPTISDPVDIRTTFEGTDSSPPPEEPSPSTVSSGGDIYSERKFSRNIAVKYPYSSYYQNSSVMKRNADSDDEQDQSLANEHSWNLQNSAKQARVTVPVTSTQDIADRIVARANTPDGQKVAQLPEPRFVFAKLAPKMAMPPTPNSEPPPLPTSPSVTLPNVVSISIRAPTVAANNTIFSNYDENREILTKPDVQPPAVPTNPPLRPPHGTPMRSTFSPSYSFSTNGRPSNSSPLSSQQSLSSKYAEEKARSTATVEPPAAVFGAGILSPASRERPYGNDATILKSDLANKPDAPMADSPNHSMNPIFAASPVSPLAKVKDTDESSDDDSRSEDTARPNSLPVVDPLVSMSYTAVTTEIGGDGNIVTRSLLTLVAEEDVDEFIAALHEKPAKYTFHDYSSPSTSILRNAQSKAQRARSSLNRIRFSSEKPLAYAYIDEVSATCSQEWNNGAIVEYSYFQKLAEQEAEQNERNLLLLQEWQHEVAAGKSSGINGTESSNFADAHPESSLSPAY